MPSLWPWPPKVPEEAVQGRILRQVVEEVVEAAVVAIAAEAHHARLDFLFHTHADHCRLHGLDDIAEVGRAGGFDLDRIRKGGLVRNGGLGGEHTGNAESHGTCQQAGTAAAQGNHLASLRGLILHLCSSSHD